MTATPWFRAVFALALADNGSLRGTARALRISYSTARRLCRALGLPHRGPGFPPGAAHKGARISAAARREAAAVRRARASTRRA